MITFEQAYDYIKNADSDHIHLLFYTALVDKKIDYVNLSNAYVEFINHIAEDNLDKLVEAETCVMESLIYDKMGTKKQAKDSVQRRLLLLNKSHRFDCESLNDKYNYIGDDEARELSYYERSKDSLI